MASIIVDEKISDLGHSRADFPRENALQLIERLSAEIPDRTHRAKFREVALSKLE
jgi:hypothetical protein